MSQPHISILLLTFRRNLIIKIHVIHTLSIRGDCEIEVYLEEDITLIGAHFLYDTRF